MSDDTTRWRGDGAPTPLNPPEARAAKDAPVIHVLGAFQELSATLGLARSFFYIRLTFPELDDLLRDVQRDLYVIKADFAAATADAVVAGIRIPRPTAAMVQRIDAEVARLEARLGSKPDRFVLEGGDPAGASLYLANEVARRAERLLVALLGTVADDDLLSPKLRFGQQYLNHLSYLLYLLARVTNRSIGHAEECIATDPATGEVTVTTDPPR